MSEAKSEAKSFSISISMATEFACRSMEYAIKSSWVGLACGKHLSLGLGSKRILGPCADGEWMIQPLVFCQFKISRLFHPTNRDSSSHSDLLEQHIILCPEAL